MASDSDALINYTPKPFPQIDGGQGRFVTDELRKISATLNLLVQVVKKIDARLTAHGW